MYKSNQILIRLHLTSITYQRTFILFFSSSIKRNIFISYVSKEKIFHHIMDELNFFCENLRKVNRFLQRFEHLFFEAIRCSISWTGYLNDFSRRVFHLFIIWRKTKSLLFKSDWFFLLQLLNSLPSIAIPHELAMQ